ncbi:MAG: hypothetical protein DRG87_12180 [Deltaproteobacteria bacterium]|nr:hypothetical protein [Deltaproteobacteria bacterium]MBW2312515.1 hypothetical protein [Deltaproteobacteria bacterium]RLB27041.1 MAG: hypothetical protein DRG87_12180 [Deltaproteobacteria bacterium]
MRRLHQAGALVLAYIMIAGCSALNVAQRGSYIDQKSIPVDVPRNILLTQYGEPVETRMENGSKIDVFLVVQGEKTGSKVAKSTGLIFLDIITLCLAEVVADPVTKQREYVFFEVFYTADDRVERVHFFK